MSVVFIYIWRGGVNIHGRSSMAYCSHSLTKINNLAPVTAVSKNRSEDSIWADMNSLTGSEKVIGFLWNYIKDFRYIHIPNKAFS
jgi:hypothetical protein